MDDRYGIPERESEAVEFKLSMSEIDSAIKAGSAMLNSSFGGAVYIGVRDDGAIVGIEIGDRTHNSLATALAKLAPRYWPETVTIDVGSGKSVLALRFPGNTGVYRFCGKPYVRVGASNHELPEDQYQKKVLEQFHGLERWEIKPSRLDIESLDLQLLNQISETAISNSPAVAPVSRAPLQLLQWFGLTTDTGLNNAAAVLFGKSEALLQQYPQCSIRLARFEGITKNTFRDNRQYVGNLFELLRLASIFVAEHNPIASHIVHDEIQRRDTPTYTPVVVREALVNALVHRDYAAPGGSVDVAIYDDRMEITSTGGLRFGLTVEDLLVVHQSRPWNPTIAMVLQTQGIFEKWGRGTTRMIELSRIAGAPDPIYFDSRHAFTVRLARGDASSGVPSNFDARILAALAEHGSLSASEIARVLGWAGSVRQLRSVLDRLRADNKITVIGERRGARWRLIGNE